MGTLPPHRGGTAVIGTYLVTGLAARGHAVRALSPLPAANGGDDAFAASHPEVRITRFPVPPMGDLRVGAREERYRRAEDSEVRSWLPRLVQAERPDVIVVGREIIAREVPPVARAHGIPTVLLAHGGPTLLSLANTNNSEPFVRELLPRIREMDLTIAVARHVAATLRSVGAQRVVTIPNAVDLDRLTPAPAEPGLRRQLGVGADSVVVLHASNLRPLKRVSDLIAATALAFPANRRLVGVVLGDGPDRAVAEAACRSHGLADRIHFLGWVGQDRIPGFMSIADLVVLPSAYEGQSCVYLEAQASGRLLIASDIPAAREVVEDGRSGLLFRAGDVGDLAAKILLGAGAPGLRARIGRRARRAAEAHGIPAFLERYETALAMAVRRGPVGETPDRATHAGGPSVTGE